MSCPPHVTHTDGPLALDGHSTPTTSFAARERSSRSSATYVARSGGGSVGHFHAAGRLKMRRNNLRPLHAFPAHIIGVSLSIFSGAAIWGLSNASDAWAEDTLDQAIEAAMPIVCEHWFVRQMRPSSVRTRAAHELDRKYERLEARFDHATAIAATKIAAAEHAEKGSCPIAGWTPEKALSPEVVNQRKKEIAMWKESEEISKRYNQCRRSCGDPADASEAAWAAWAACHDGCSATQRAENRAFDERWR